jgi:hypothetical protein
MWARSDETRPKGRGRAMLVGALVVPILLCLAHADKTNADVRNFNSEVRVGSAKPWRFVRRLGRSTVELSFAIGICSKETVPKIHPRVRERPGRAVITIWVSIPEAPAGTPCMRSLKKRKIRVKLGKPITKLKLFDGSHSPPILRWPR